MGQPIFHHIWFLVHNYPNAWLEYLIIYCRFPMVDTITKTQYGILMALMQYMNATPIIIRTDQWGVIEDFDTERWGGMCGFIQRKEADISGNLLSSPKNQFICLTSYNFY